MARHCNCTGRPHFRVMVHPCELHIRLVVPYLKHRTALRGLAELSTPRRARMGFPSTVANMTRTTTWLEQA